MAPTRSGTPPLRILSPDPRRSDDLDGVTLTHEPPRRPDVSDPPGSDLHAKRGLTIGELLLSLALVLVALGFIAGWILFQGGDPTEFSAGFVAGLDGIVLLVTALVVWRGLVGGGQTRALMAWWHDGGEFPDVDRLLPAVELVGLGLGVVGALGIVVFGDVLAAPWYADVPPDAPDSIAEATGLMADSGLQGNLAVVTLLVGWVVWTASRMLEGITGGATRPWRGG